jgi:hypothetical protein
MPPSCERPLNSCISPRRRISLTENIFSGSRLDHTWKTVHSRFALTGPYRVRWRYGSRVHLPELCQSDCSFPRLVGSSADGLHRQLQGELLSSRRAGSARLILAYQVRATIAGPVPRFLIGRRPPEIVHRPKTTTPMVDIVHRRLTSCLDVSNTCARLELASQLHLQALVAPLRKATRVYGGWRSK